MSTPSDDAKIRDSWDEWYRSGGGFHWCWPKLGRMRAADKVTFIGLNRYPHNIIGIALYVRGHGFGLRWKTS